MLGVLEMMVEDGITPSGRSYSFALQVCQGPCGRHRVRACGMGQAGRIESVAPPHRSKNSPPLSIKTPTAVSGTGHTRKQMYPFEVVIRYARKYRTHNVWKSASQGVLSRMQLTLHATPLTPHAASRLVHAISAWSVKTRRAPSRHL